MYRFYIPPEQIGDKKLLISGTDVNHIRNVLRMKPGERIIACDGQGMDYICEILSLEKEEIFLRELSHAPAHTELPVKITLFQGIPKKDKMELIIQKAVELGAAELVPVEMKRCVAKLKEPKKEAKKREHWQGIAEAAAKQSGRGVVPAIKPAVSYAEALKQAAQMDLILIPYENARGMQTTKEAFQKAVRLAEVERTVPAGIGIFIGPEGGFTSEEIESAKAVNAEVISLGKRILRTETAGLAVLAMLMYEIECGMACQLENLMAEK